MEVGLSAHGGKTMTAPFILPQIQRTDWPGRDSNVVKALHSRLQPGPGEQTIPLVSWAYASGPMAAFVGPSWLEKNDMTAEQVHEQALANLATREPALRFLELPNPDGGVDKLATLEGDRNDNPDHIAAADHILNRAALAKLHESLGAAQIVVAIPARQTLFAADVSLAIRGPFINLANKLPFEGAERLTTAVFLVQDAEIVGKLNYGA